MTYRVRISPLDVASNFVAFFLDCWQIFGVILLGVPALAALLCYFESRADRWPLTASGPSRQEMTAPAVGESLKAPQSGQLLRSRTAGKTDIQTELEQVRLELHRLSSGVAGMHQDLSAQLSRESERLRALEENLRSLMGHWRRLEESRRAGFGTSLYYICGAMLGLSDFGVQTMGGKAVVVGAGIWGVLGFALMIALFLNAIRVASEEDSTG